MLRPMKKMCARNIKLQESVGAKLTIMPGDLGTISDRRSLAQKKQGHWNPAWNMFFIFFMQTVEFVSSNLCSRFFYNCNQLLAHIFWLAIRISKRGLADHDIYPIFSRGSCWGLFNAPIKTQNMTFINIDQSIILAQKCIARCWIGIISILSPS